MAGYRPKSLDELNSLYDKSKNAKDEIYKKASDLEVKSEVYTPVAPEADETEAYEKSREEAAAEEISGLVGDFIKSFGTPVPVKKVRPASVVATPIKAVSSAKAPATMPQTAEGQTVQSAYAPVNEKPKLIRSDERNELFEDYKKVMDDDGEEETSRLRRGRRKGKKLFEKKNSETEIAVTEEKPQSEPYEAADIGAASEISYEALIQGTAVEEPEIPETLENIDAVIEKVLGRAVEHNSADDESVAEKTEAEELPAQQEEADYPEIREEAQEEIQAYEPVDAVEEIVPVVEEEVQEIVPQLEQEEPDAPVTEEQSEVSEQENVELRQEYYGYEEDYSNEASQSDDDDSYSEEDEEDEEDDRENDEEIYYNAPVKKRYAGKNLLLIMIFFVLLLATAVSAIKAFSGINSDTLLLEKYYLYTAGSSYEQAGINKGDLVVVSREDIKPDDVFAFSKGDGEYGFAKLESELNAESVVADTDGQKSIVFKNTLRGVFYKSIPFAGAVAAIIMSQYLYVVGGLFLLAAILFFIAVFAFRDKKDKAAKKSRKKEKAEETEDVSENAAEQETPYDAVDDDFKYLIREDDGDEFDVYRKEYTEEADGEGLPVYQAENYKYEPDEYVNN